MTPIIYQDDRDWLKFTPWRYGKWTHQVFAKGERLLALTNGEELQPMMVGTGEKMTDDLAQAILEAFHKVVKT